MNCYYHIHNQVTTICIAPHQFQCQRKLCAECQDEHGVDAQHMVSIKKFKQMVKQKLGDAQLDQKYQIASQKAKFKSVISSTQNMLKQFWEELSEAIRWIYEEIEIEVNSFNNIINEDVNPTELSNTEIEQLVQMVIGKTLDVRKDLKNSILQKLEKMLNFLNNETTTFSERLNKKTIEKIPQIKQVFQQQMIIKPISKIEQGYQRKEDIYEVFVQTKQFDEQFLNRIIEKFRKEKVTDCIKFLSAKCNKKNIKQYKMQFITELMQNINENAFNEKNYQFLEARRNLIKQIANDDKIVQFLKFLVQLTSIDEKFIQCGSNSLNLLIEMKVNMKEHNLEKIRIRDTSLIGANMVRCNLNESTFQNVDISGMNLNGAQLFNCKWKNIKITEQNKKDTNNITVNSVCFSADGTTLASGTIDQYIRLWDVKTGQQKALLDGHCDSVLSVCFSPDGTTLASGSGDKSIRLWDFNTMQQKAKLDCQDYVYTICFSHDGTTLASGSGDNSIRLWDVKTEQLKAKLDGHQEYVYTVCFSPDGTTLASCSGDKSIRLWNIKTGQQKVKLDGHQEYVYSVCFSPDGSKLASGSGDNTINLWDFQTGQQKDQLNGHTDYVYSVCFSPDGTVLASSSGDSSICLWDVRTKQLKAKLDGHSSGILSVCFSPDGTTLASGGFDCSIRLWDVKERQSDTKKVCFSRDGTTLAFESHDQPMSFWDVKSGQQIRPSDIRHKEISAYFDSFAIKNSIPTETATCIQVILPITSKPNLEAKGALILQGEFLNSLGHDQRQIFRDKGSHILEGYI